MRIYTLDAIAEAVGTMLGTTGWLFVDQPLIDSFADLSGDRQWIHVDPERSAGGTYGVPIAHGLLVLSLLPALTVSLFEVVGVGSRINYGYDRVRFPSPLPVNSEIRNRVTLLGCDPRNDGHVMLRLGHKVEARGHDRPVCVAESLTLLTGEQAA